MAGTLRFLRRFPPAFTAELVIISLSLLVFEAIAVAGALTELETRKLKVTFDAGA